MFVLEEICSSFWEGLNPELRPPQGRESRSVGMALQDSVYLGLEFHSNRPLRWMEGSEVSLRFSGSIVRLREQMKMGDELSNIKQKCRLCHHLKTLLLIETQAAQNN